MEQMELPARYGIMVFMDLETRSRLLKAARNFTRLRDQLEAARAELAEAIVAERKQGTLIEDIAALVPYRQTHVNRILEAAGLTEKRAKRED